MTTKCLHCHRDFITYPCRIKIGLGKYCGKDCSNKETLFEKGNKGFWLGKKRPGLMNTSAGVTMFKPGITSWNKGKRKKHDIVCAQCKNILPFSLSAAKRRRFCSTECSIKSYSYLDKRDNNCLSCKKNIMRKSIYCRDCAQKGERGPQWKGGKTSISKIVRESSEYKRWRTKVFERDNFCCVVCSKRGVINADHIKSFSYYPELRFNIDNGRTLCVECHKSTPNYGYKARLLEGGGAREFQG